MLKSFVFAALSFCLFAEAAGAAEFSVRKTDDGVTVFINGNLFTKYVVKNESNKPYFWPIVGPDGVHMTRAYPMKDVAGEKQDHPHHRSMWFGHQRMAGTDTWHEARTFEERYKNKPDQLAERLKVIGATRHKQVTTAEARGDHAVLVASSDYVDSSGNLLLQDVREFTFRQDDSNAARVIDVTITLVGAGQTITLQDAKDSGFSIRVAHSICVDAKQGGKILNSLGHEDKAAWGKRASWCDFYGQVDGKPVGIAILNHPSSFRFPTPWHARSYGLFTANPFGLQSVAKESESGSVTLEKGQKIALRYRVIFHRGTPQQANIAAAFETYAK